MTQPVLWKESLYPTFGQYFVPQKILYEKKTAHQEIVIFEHDYFGRVMALDGVVQTTEKDEFIYHEMMAHVPLHAHANPKRVLIIGGGDGGMLREVCKHQQVEKITMVEIDAGVVEFCQTYLPNHSRGAYQDSRLELVISDGAAFVEETSQQYDVIISDCTDPVGPGESLFSSRFYAGIKRCLAKEGIFVAQNGVCFLQQDEVINTHQRLSAYFQDQSFYSAAIPTYYGGIMTFAWASQSLLPRSRTLNDITERYQQTRIKTAYYNPAVHCASFALPQYVLEVLSTK